MFKKCSGRFFKHVVGNILKVQIKVTSFINITAHENISENTLNLFSYLDVYFTKLHFGNFIWSTTHNVLCITIHREWDNLTDILLIAK